MITPDRGAQGRAPPVSRTMRTMRPITAADLMNPTVLAVRDDMTLRELAAFLVRNQITGAPVEDGGGRLVGVVSTVDIAEAVLESAGETGEPAAAGRAEGGFFALDWEEEPDEDDLADLRRAEEDLLVRDIMTPSVYSVSEDATVSEIASRMLDSHVHRLLVTREGRPVGIITTSDLLGLLIDE
jgi:CBS domain-containing protein